MHIETLPMWTGTGNNYAYLLRDDATQDSMIIDPAHPPEVLPTLEKLPKGSLKAIINTHHHHDHAGGNSDILAAFPGLPVIGGADCELKTHTPAHEEQLTLGSNITIQALHTPCHTQDSICYYVEDKAANQRAVFTGDTLFIGGCGRFFEGTAGEMLAALEKRLGSLPEDTTVWPGHEYTAANAKFGVSVLDVIPLQKLVKFAEENKVTAGKVTIGQEKRHNVFMRTDDPMLMQATGGADRIEVMSKLREMKNSFKG